MTAPSRAGGVPSSDLDILRAAEKLLDGHGRLGAWMYAAQRAQECAGQNDMEGVAVWGRVLDALQELTRTEPGAGEATH